MIQKYFALFICVVSFCGCGASLYNDAPRVNHELTAVSGYKTMGLPVSIMSTKFTNTDLVEEDSTKTSKHVNRNERFVPSTSDIYSAARDNNVDDIHYFYQLGIDIDAKRLTLFGPETPLQAAAKKNNVEAAELLLELGANVHMRDWRGRTALHWAAQYNSAEVAEILIREGADMNLFSNSKRTPTPLMTAVARNNLEITKVLLESGADLELTNDNGKKAYQLAHWRLARKTRRLIKDHEKGLMKTERAEILSVSAP